MPKATATFLGPSQQSSNSLWIVVSYVDSFSNPVVLPSEPAIWNTAIASRPMIEEAFLKAICSDQYFPLSESTVLLGTLGWKAEMSQMLAAKPTGLELKMSQLTCPLLPELCPVCSIDGQSVWLDRVLPVYRVMGTVPRAAAPRQSKMSLAVLYQDSEIFDKMAHTAGRALRSTFDSVNLYPGRHVADPDKQISQLQEIFLRHRAVLFLGHLHKPTKTDCGGWELTENEAEYLPLTTVEGLLKGVLKALMPSQKTHPNPLSIPELVFAGCCSGAWGAPGADGPIQFFYPCLFLDNGVRFFVGSWMDILLAKPKPDDLIGTITNFLGRWSRDPNDATQALFDAKWSPDPDGAHGTEIKGSSSLLASMFQLYVAPELTETHEKGAEHVRIEEPTAAPRPLAANLTAGTHLGIYRLDSEMWQDPWATVFWAHRTDDHSPHIIQVLVDEWQDDLHTRESLKSALTELYNAKLPDSQWVPVRIESLKAGGIVSTGPDLLALVYDRPVDETESSWSRLSDCIFDASTPNDFQRVLELGAAISARLCELHERKIQHGSFDPAAVILRNVGGHFDAMIKDVAIKDVWVKHVQPGRCTYSRYTAPDARLTKDSLKVDCYGFGGLMFELAVGRSRKEGEISVRAAVGNLASFVPEALERIVGECLAPSESVRPSSDQITRRLRLAVHAGGNYLSDLGQSLDLNIAAGHRLFAIRVDFIEDLLRVLDALQANATAHYRYRLYTAAEYEGVIDPRLRDPVIRWMDGAQVRRSIIEQTRQDPGPIQPDVEAFVNASNLFDWIGAMSAAALDSSANLRKEMPMVLIRGVSWWQVPQIEELQRFHRVLKTCQRERGSPVIVIADSYLNLIGDPTLPFEFFEFPAPTPSELFERVLSAPERLRCEALQPEQAVDFSERLFPCTTRELEESLKLCAIRYAKIDHHVVDIRDDDRARRFRSLGTLDYTPASRLPAFDHFGWPPKIEPELRNWVQTVKDDWVAPRRLLISGPFGYGKTTAPRSLAQALDIPLFRLDASACLQKDLGESEQMLAISLEVVGTLGGAVVLVDDLDKFISPAAGVAPVDATIMRMSVILSHWIDRLPSRVILFATARTPELLPGAWRRRFEKNIPLGFPALDSGLSDSLEYRQSVLAALFRRFGLSEHAKKREFLIRLAKQTCPAGRHAPLADAVARVRPSGPLGGFVVSLKTGADLESWMAETLLLHTPPGDLAAPEGEEFWIKAAQ